MDEESPSGFRPAKRIAVIAGFLFFMEDPIQMDGLGFPLFLKPPFDSQSASVPR